MALDSGARCCRAKLTRSVDVLRANLQTNNGAESQELRFCRLWIRLFGQRKAPVKEGALIQVVDPAVVPDRRSFPMRGLIFIGATATDLQAGINSALSSAFMGT